MSARSLAEVRDGRDTRPSRWSVWSQYIITMAWPLFATAYWLAALILGVLVESVVAFLAPTLWMFAAALLSYILLLVAPARPWVRATSIAVPAFAAFNRLMDMLLHDPIAWSGALSRIFILFAMTYVAYRLRPPPLSNGALREYHHSRGQ